MNCKLLSFDLDGTILHDDKTVSRETIQALSAAHDSGILIVPTTGRIYSGLPEQILALPFLDYCIVGNGSGVYDVKNGTIISSIPLTAEDVLKITGHYSTPRAIYGIYQGNRGFMPASMYELIPDYLPGSFFPGYLKKMYKPVESLEVHFADDSSPVNKLNVYFKSEELKYTALHEAEVMFSDYSVSSSLATIVEFTNKEAHKGNALKLLCREIGIDIADTVAFGDGGNDMSLIREAGMGVAMANAIPELKAAADYVTLTNEEDGVAAVINRILAGTF